ncbi:MAG TPA: MFS transporter [Candidatus Thermoplasmatota archaeon]|nr:MFS transporter [Candidatus Thermoplasmatota archaeon]
MSVWARALHLYGVDDARSYGRTPWIITAGTLIVGIGRGIVAPFLILFLVQERGIALAAIGLGIAVEFLVRAVSGPFAGALSDRYGRKPLMLAGLLCTSVILPSYLLVHTGAQYMALSVVNGLFASLSLYGPASSALIVDVVPSTKRAGVFGLIHAARNLGWTVGIALGALLLSAGFLPIFIAGGVLPFCYLFLVLFFVEEPARHAALARRSMAGDWALLLRTPTFAAYLALSTIFFLGWGQINTIFALFLTDGLSLDRRAVAVIAVNTVLIVLLQVPFGRLADRSERAFLLAVSAVLLEATYALYALAAGAPAPFVVVILGIVAFTFAEMLYSPIQSAFAAELAPEGTTGSALGIMAFAAALGQGAPPLLADWTLSRWGWSGVWMILAALCLPAALGLLWLGRRLRADRARAQPRTL